MEAVLKENNIPNKLQFVFNTDESTNEQTRNICSKERCKNMHVLMPHDS
jgi:hypothetical protein